MKKKLKKTLNIIKEILSLVIDTILDLFRTKPKPPQAPVHAATPADVEAYLQALVEHGTPPGISVAVVKDGDIVYNKAFGFADAPQNIPTTLDTVYKWWSVTKIITATAILQLHERNKLDIDTPVVDYLPFFDVEYPSENSATITVRHILNHSSGLPDNVPAVIGWMHFEDEPQLDQTALLEKILPDYKKLIFEPGDHSEYTNVGYMVLGAIIEAVSGQTYQDYIIENIFKPLRMDHSNFFYTEEMKPLAAAGSHPRISLDSFLLPFFYDDLSQLLREKSVGKIWFNRFYADSDPPTGMIAPATDVIRFILAYLNGGELDGVRILSPETVNMMSSESHIAAANKGQSDRPISGLGWAIYPQGDRLFLGHGGGGPGFGSLICLNPQESLGMLVVANDTTYDKKKIIELLIGLDW